jgi:ribonuclease Z
MSNTIDISLVNGLSGDPAVYCSIVQSGESILFDAGSLESMTNRELLKVRVVAVTHTHVDHFIGFDRLIRVNIPHFRTVEVVGPEGIHANVEAKLKAYTWNLLEPGQINYIVHEVNAQGAVTTYQLSSDRHFDPLLLARAPAAGQRVVIPLQNIHAFSLFAASLDHGMQVLAFELRLPDTLTVDKSSLQISGLVAGPWIAELQRLAGEARFDGQIDVHGTSHPVRELARQLLKPRVGDSVLYVTDILFCDANVRAIQTLCRDSAGHFICEANYRDADRAKAFSKYHLTTRQAALLAATVKARDFQIFHVSNIYAGDIESSVAESRNFFDEYSLLEPQALAAACSQEFPS